MHSQIIGPLHTKVFIFQHYFRLQTIKSKSNLHYIRGITPKRVTSGGVYLHGSAPAGQHSSEKTLHRYRAVGDTVSELSDPGIEPQTPRTDSYVLYN